MNRRERTSCGSGPVRRVDDANTETQCETRVPTGAGLFGATASRRRLLCESELDQVVAEIDRVIRGRRAAGAARECCVPD
jgi:hypothetical protein